MKAPVIIFSICMMFICPAMNAQMEEVMERMAETMEASPDFSELQEEWLSLSQHPVNLNSAREEDLRRVPGLSELQIKSIMEYKASYGEIFSVYELMAIPEFDSLDIQKIQPYLIVLPVVSNPRFSLKNLFRYGRHSLLVRYGQSFPSSEAYRAADPETGAEVEPVYPGNPHHYYFRYSFSWHDKIQIGLAGEKDPGEQFFLGSQSRGMDYYSGYLSLSNMGILKNLTIGTFRAGFGQGLTFGSGSALGNAPGLLSGLVSIPMAKGSTSVSESNYLKGLTATFKIRKVELTAFVSYHGVDANILTRDSLSGKVLQVSSLISSGYHRTKSELEDRHAMTELLTGGNFNVTGKFFRIGASAYFSKWSASLSPKLRPYNQFTLTGSECFAYGLDYQFRLNSLFLFGEISRCQSGTFAFLAGLDAEPDARVKMRIIFRHYPAAYVNPRARAFGQQSSNTNESGLYAALQAELHPKLTVSVYADLYRYPWLRYQSSRPTRAVEFGLQLSSPLTKTCNFNARYYYSKNSSNSSLEDSNSEKIVEAGRQNLRFTIDWIPLPEISLKSRVEVNLTTGDEQAVRTGYLICQDIHYRPEKFPVGAILRYSLFDIPTYGERIYIYEPDVLYGYAVPAFYGKGMRFCLLVNGKVNRHLKCWVKAGMTTYFDRKVIGSGKDMVNADTKWDLTIQFMIQ